MFIEIAGKKLEIKFTPRSYQYLGQFLEMGKDPGIFDILKKLGTQVVSNIQWEKAAALIQAGLLHEKEITKEWVFENILDDTEICADTIDKFHRELYVKTFMFNGMARTEAEKAIENLITGDGEVAKKAALEVKKKRKNPKGS